MRSNFIKILSVIIITLFLASPVLSSTTKKTLTDTKEYTELNELKELTPDPKIQAMIDLINESYIRDILTHLCLDIGARYTQTYGAEQAAKYIFEEFEKMGLQTSFHYFKDFNYRIKKPRIFKDKSIEAILPGIEESTDEIIIFNAHYDTTKDSQGAIDDGTGVAAVMAAAQALSKFGFNRSIYFLTFSGEEVGLIGSRNYVRDIYKNDTDLLLQINADMVGYATNATEGKMAYLSQSQEAGWFLDEIQKVNQIYDFGFDLKKSSFDLTAIGNTRYGSDYWDFVYHGYNSIAFWESGRYEYANTPYDYFEYINFSYLTNMTKIIAASIAHLADLDVYYPQIQIGAPRRGCLYFEDKIIKEFKHEQTIVFDDILIYPEIKPGDAPIERVEFYYDGKLMFTDEEKPYQWRLNKGSLFLKHEVEVKIIDEIGRETSDFIKFRYINWRLDK